MKKLRNHILILCGLLIFGIVFLSLTVNAASSVLPWLSPGGTSKPSSESAAKDTLFSGGTISAQYDEDAGSVYIAPIGTFPGIGSSSGSPGTADGTGTVSIDGGNTSGSSAIKAGTSQAVISIQPVSVTDSASDAKSSASSAAPASSGSDSLDPSGQTPTNSSDSDPSSSSPGRSSDDSDGSSHHHRSVSITGVGLDHSDLKLVKGASTALAATITPSNTTQSKTIVWSSSDKSVATVDGSGKVTAVEGGTVTVTATTSNGKTAVCKVTVSVPTQGIKLNHSELSLIKSTTSAALVATVTPNDASDQTVTWLSSDESVATVDGSGKVTAVEGGTATVTATASNGKAAACKVTVSVPATKVTLSLSDVPVERGKTIALVATLDPPDSTDKVLWATSDNAIATVDDSGQVTGISAGNATITASVGDGAISVSCQVTTVVSISELDLSDTELSLKKGEGHNLTAQVLPEDTTEDKTVTWSSSDKTVATVDSSGKITAVEGGTAIVTAQTGKHSAQCTVTVTVPVTGISFNQTTLVLPVNTTSSAVEVTISPDDATDKAVSWTSSDPSVVTVDNAGQITAVSAGTATITATSNDGVFTANCTVTVVVPVTGISLNKTALSLIKGNANALTATITPEDATDKAVAWTSSNPSVAVVDSNGKVTATGGGTATITAKTNDGGFAASCTVTVKVPVTGITLDKNSLTLARGKTGKLIPTIAPDDATDKAVSWTSSDPSVVTVDNAGQITAVSAGTVTVTATSHDGGFTANCTVTVVVPVTGISLDKATLSLIKGNAATLTATITPEDATNKAVAWTSSNPSVAAVDSNGKVTATGGGTATITVTAKDGGFAASCTVTVKVPVTGITLNQSNLTLIRGKTRDLIPTISPADATDKAIVWSTSNSSVVTVDNAGRITAISAGTAIITATTHNGGFTSQCTVTVVVPVTGISLDKATLSLIKGNAATLTATITPEDATNKAVAWTSSNPSVAAVDSSGKVTAVGGGTATITVTAKDGGFAASCTVTVKVPVTGITLNHTSTTIAPGEFETLTATITPVDASNKNVTWSSSNPSVATVDEYGKVTSIGFGTTTITATTRDGNYTCQCAVTVPITWTPETYHSGFSSVHVHQDDPDKSIYYIFESHNSHEHVGVTYTFNTPISISSGDKIEVAVPISSYPQYRWYRTSINNDTDYKIAFTDQHNSNKVYTFSADTVLSSVNLDVETEISIHNEGYARVYLYTHGRKILLNASGTESP
ncbi:Ig-like domain-containing protein [Caproicibacter fermentans]|uniref:Ig-like domain-containing protein n=1 Tax=Caproicibacter fermentans TaxID=2576756 RepID=A0A7G8TD59_9FIRM|nr:Ig-like domain-containing protein [Caproicibacter fermentans]QNK41550.1 Ig-like domain-containing protein [Caproicibacter fermentans]